MCKNGVCPPHPDAVLIYGFTEHCAVLFPGTPTHN